MGARLTARVMLLIAVPAAALTLGACGGGGGEPDLANGKQQFTSACGGCHTLADAGTSSTVGPNLDDAFRGAREHDFKTSGFEGIIKYWVQNPEKITEPLMPANLVTGQDLDDLAAYVAAVAGTKDADSPARPAEEVE